MDHPAAARFADTEVIQEHTSIVLIEQGDFRLDLARDRVDHDTRSTEAFFGLCDQRLRALAEQIVAQIEQDEQRLSAEEAEATQKLLIFRLQLDLADRRAFFECGMQLLQHGELALVHLALSAT